MSVTDSQCVQWLEHEQVSIRTAALELLSGSFSTNARWCDAIFHAWDRFGPTEAFPEFPLLTHLEIPVDRTSEAIDRAAKMVEGKPIIDRGCRSAGKLIEAISVSSPNHFIDHLDRIAELKRTSKIFFRVDVQRMKHRAELMDRDPAYEPLTVWFQKESPPDLPYGIYPHLEAGYLRGQADEALRLGFEQLSSESRKPFVLEACLELASRYRLLGYEAWFADGLNDENTAIADASAIALSRCRNDQVLSLIADRFAGYSKSGQLRSIDVLRRSRLPKTPELLRFLKPHAQGTSVRNALCVAEILQFDFGGLEDWLEALMVIDDPSLARIRPLLCLAGPLSLDLPESDRARALHLVRTRVSLE
jgi:hypothetical protein